MKKTNIAVRRVFSCIFCVSLIVFFVEVHFFFSESYLVVLFALMGLIQICDTVSLFSERFRRFIVEKEQKAIIIPILEIVVMVLTIHITFAMFFLLIIGEIIVILFDYYVTINLFVGFLASVISYIGIILLIVLKVNVILKRNKPYEEWNGFGYPQNNGQQNFGNNNPYEQGYSSQPNVGNNNPYSQGYNNQPNIGNNNPFENNYNNGNQ